MTLSLQSPRLRAALSADEHRLHRAALEWDLDASLAINDPKDIESRKHWSSRGLEPYEHQVKNLLTFCRRAPVALIADDVGLGKTISAGLVLSELTTRRRVQRALVLCPKILLPQWREELETKFGLVATAAVGNELARALGNRATEIVLTTYDSARSRFSDIEQARFDMLILDEAHKLRNLFGSPGGAPKFATAVRKALENRAFKYVVMLTATPIKNRLWDLYSLIDCLTVAKGHRNPLGDPDSFSSRFMSTGGRVLQLNPGRRDEFHRILSQYMVRTRRADAKLQFPERDVRKFREAATEHETRLMGLVGRAMRGMPALQQVSLAQALMSSPEAFLAQLDNTREQAALGDVMAAARAAVASREPTAKSRLLLQFLGELKAKNPTDWRALVFTTRKETQNMIGARLAEAGIATGFIRGGVGPANERAIQAFRRSPPGVNVIVSTDAGAEGVNLQACNVVINYDLPWDPMIVEQRIGRVQRLASRFERVVVANLTVAGSVEERIVERLLSKLQLIASTVGDVEAILESVEEDSDEGSFEARIQRMVLAALNGADVERDLRLAAESIDRAKKIYEEEKEVVEKQLGGLDDMHRSGPAMPSLSKRTPSLSVRDFVMGALAADGARVGAAGGEWFRADVPGRGAFHFSFDGAGPAPAADPPPVFLGDRARVFGEGRPDFTRLVGEWTKRGEHAVIAARHRDEVARTAALRWCRDLDAELKDLSVAARRPGFQGSVTCRVSAGVAHDRYEKLVDLVVRNPEHPNVAPADVQEGLSRQRSREIDVSELHGSLREDAHAEASKDADIAGFCSFYRKRLEEELVAAGGRPELVRRAHDSFEPFLAGQVVCAAGVEYELVTLKIEAMLEQSHPYTSEVVVLSATGQVVEDPPRAACEVTNRRVPDEWLERCAETNRVALRHLLAKSAESGRLVLRKLLVPCPISGELVLQKELVKSALSGREGRRGLFKASAVSSTLALPDELVPCEMTGALLLPDEALVSDVSHRRFRSDQAVRSAVSGLIGHESEFVTCAVSSKRLLTSEAVQSAVSGRYALPELAVRSELPPNRPGLPDEAVVCAHTGRRLLSDETVSSSVSGRLIGRDVARQSSRSGRWAAQDEIVRCQASGAELLSDEVSACALSGKTVDVRLLERSAVSGTPALKALMIECAETKAWILPTESTRCEVTGLTVRRDLTDACTVTGKRALRRCLVQSAISGAFLLPERAVKSPSSGRYAAPNEVVRCSWTQSMLLPIETRHCALTGLRIDTRYLNEAGELRVLRDLLDRQEGGALRQDLQAWLKQFPPRRPLADAARVLAVPSPSGELLALAVETHSLLGLRVRHISLIVRDGLQRTPLGRVLEGRRTATGWVVERELQ